MTQARKARGMRTQLVVAEYLRENGWPHAGSAGAGRNGADITETPDIAVEVKARADLSPLAWVRQAEKAAAGRLPFVVFRPNGMGEHPQDYVTFMRLADLVSLLRAAGYGDGLPSGSPVDRSPGISGDTAHHHTNDPTKETQP